MVLKGFNMENCKAVDTSVVERSTKNAKTRKLNEEERKMYQEISRKRTRNSPDPSFISQPILDTTSVMKSSRSHNEWTKPFTRISLQLNGSYGHQGNTIARKQIQDKTILLDEGNVSTKLFKRVAKTLKVVRAMCAKPASVWHDWVIKQFITFCVRY